MTLENHPVYVLLFVIAVLLFAIEAFTDRRTDRVNLLAAGLCAFALPFLLALIEVG